MTKDPVLHPLEGLGSVLEAERKAEKLEESKESNEVLEYQLTSWESGNNLSGDQVWRRTWTQRFWRSNQQQQVEGMGQGLWQC